MSKALPRWSKVLIVVLAILLASSAALTVRYRDVVFHDRGNIDSTEGENATSILFVGNSMIFYGNVPGQLKAIAGEQGVAITFKDISRNGAFLSELRSGALDEIQSRRFDYVVLQDNAARPFNDVQGFLDDMRVLCEAARKCGAIPVLYNPAWASTDGKPDAERLSVSTALYQQAAEENGAILVNAADAWIFAYETIPGISLYKAFDFHANDAGAFLTACVFAAALFDMRVESIPRDNRYHGSFALDLAHAAWDSR